MNHSRSARYWKMDRSGSWDRYATKPKIETNNPISFELIGARWRKFSFIIKWIKNPTIWKHR